MSRWVLVLALAAGCRAAEWKDLFNGKNLDGWESVGDGIWTVMRDGTLVGQRDLVNNAQLKTWFESRAQYLPWLYTQAWLYTTREFSEYDLRLDYWLRQGGNSGISLRDPTRARYAVATPPDFTRTPSRMGYEIQLANHYPDNHPSGSIYNVARARTGVQIDDDWNSMEIQSRAGWIRVTLNGTVVAEHPGSLERPKTGPIGLQLHDRYSVVMFRNIRIRELNPAP